MSAERPAEWVVYLDRWHGFRVAHPDGWQVTTTAGTLRVGPPGTGASGVTSSTLNVPPAPAAQLAADLVARRRAAEPGLRAFMAPGADETRVLLRLASPARDGIWSLDVHGGVAQLTGYDVPAAERELADVLGRILATLGPVDPIPRAPWPEPGESAFVFLLPVGWLARGGVRRDTPYGLASPEAEAIADQSGSVRLAFSASNQMFSTPGPFTGAGWHGLLGGLMTSMTGTASPTSGAPVVAYQSAAGYISNVLAPAWRQATPDLSVIELTEPPELVAQVGREAAAYGAPRSAVAIGTLRFTRAGRPFRQRLLAQTYDLPMMAGWAAVAPWSYSAPEEQWPELAPILQGMADSYQLNPAWQSAQQQAVQARLGAQQAEMIARTRQISQTLSETSDIITSGYWQRQAGHERAMHKWSDATLGYEDRISDSGYLYDVLIGYDRVFRDAAGNFYGSGWLINPDPTWQELKLQ